MNDLTKENDAPDNADSRDEDDLEDLSLLTVLDLNAFLEAISAVDGMKSFTAQVDISHLKLNTSKDCANALAKSIWNRLKFRFV